MNRVETNLTWVILMGIALVSVGIFFMHNGFLLFRLNSYSQIFSSEVSGVAFKTLLLLFHPGDAGGLLSAPGQQSVAVFPRQHGRFLAC